MNESANCDERVMLALEACRPDSPDLDDPALALAAAKVASDPEWAARHQRLQAVDRRLAAAFHDVSVPQDLQQHLLMRLAENQARPRMRRWWMTVGGTAAAIAATLLMAVWLVGQQTRKPLSEQFALTQAIRFFQSGALTAEQWSASGSRPAHFPFSQAVVAPTGLRWQAIRDFLGGPAVAFELAAARGNAAVLFVTGHAVEGLGAAPAWQPFTTAGCSVSAWQENGLVYVLVVRGDAGAYQHYLRASSSPIV